MLNKFNLKIWIITISILNSVFLYSVGNAKEELNFDEAFETLRTARFSMGDGRLYEKTVKSIGQIGKVNKALMFELTDALGYYENEEIRGSIREVIFGFGDKARDYLRTPLTYGNLRTRTEILTVLKDWGKTSSFFIPDLLSVLENGTQYNRVLAIFTLEKIGFAEDPSILPALQLTLKNDDDPVIKAIILRLLNGKESRTEKSKIKEIAIKSE